MRRLQSLLLVAAMLLTGCNGVVFSGGAIHPSNTICIVNGFVSFIQTTTIMTAGSTTSLVTIVTLSPIPSQARLFLALAFYSWSIIYLIHIDGPLTRDYDAVDLSVDSKLLARLESVSRDSGRVALITGRTESWLDQHLFLLIDGDANFLVLGEYGSFRL